MLPVSMCALQTLASLQILRCLTTTALRLFLLAQAACLRGRNARSLRLHSQTSNVLSNFAETG